jgi:predicted pyridoxine 5'-phosphate oxidase superfamily flavin-nucleotide-binding protein
VRNLRHNPAIEVNVVDPIVRKGYRFKGTGRVLSKGELFDEVVALYRRAGTNSPIRAVVLVRVDRALPIISPTYDTGATEEAVRQRWERYYREVGSRTPSASELSPQ